MLFRVSIGLPEMRRWEPGFGRRGMLTGCRCILSDADVIALVPAMIVGALWALWRLCWGSNVGIVRPARREYGSLSVR